MSLIPLFVRLRRTCPYGIVLFFFFTQFTGRLLDVGHFCSVAQQLVSPGCSREELASLRSYDTVQSMVTVVVKELYVRSGVQA